MANRATPEQKLEKTRAFVIATKNMIEANNFNNIHIREISKVAGFHNSTLYSYFKDVDYLISLASVKFFERYSKSLSKLSEEKLPPYDLFIEIWKSFCFNSFSNPEIYNHFFFGKHGNDLTKIFNEYYEIFPNENPTYSKNIQEMYFGKNLYIRCLHILEPLADLETTRLNKDNLKTANRIILATFKDFLEIALCKKKDDCKDFSALALTDKFMEALIYIVAR